MTSADPVYQILKIIEKEQEPEVRKIGVHPREFNTVLKHIQEAGYVSADRLTQAGRGYIQAYELRLKSGLRTSQRGRA
ncbi:hypothetical protein [Paenibacillus sp. S150]|uniref:hypothetical protein n=1 Tax=Paenibacillus sp. S150 TaxID=2749826 RepID=UPI001C57EE44|nr:hypothetical protein [Paenibacillus sp. S150]MBW4084735.1 hypothetical protein [Paenibacillus sp. S150]